MGTPISFDADEKAQAAGAAPSIHGADLDIGLVQVVVNAGAPTVNDDTDSGYAPGYIWLDSSDGYAVYRCRTAAAGAAGWYNTKQKAYELWGVKTAAYTAVTTDCLLADSSGGAFTITLPASPSTGDKVLIADGASAGSWAANNITVARNGATIRGAASDFTLSVNFDFAEFIYDGTTWQVRQVSGSAAANQSLSNLTAAGNKKIASAWVRFNGSGTVAINDSFNVSSITDNGVGDYTANFATALADTNYAPVFGGGQTGAVELALFILCNSTHAASITTAGFRFYAMTYAANVIDPQYCEAIVFGG